VASPDGYTIANRQNFIQFGGIFGKGALQDAKLWIGKRYYNRHDVHINDYFYWNNSGQGAGIEDIEAGPVKLAFAYFQTGGNGTAKDDVVSKRYAARFYGLGLNRNGTLEGEFVYLKGSTAGDGPTGSGTALFLEHTQGGFEEFFSSGGVATMGGFNKFAFTYGKDQGNGFQWIPTYPGTGPAEGSAYGVTDQLYFELKNTNWSGMATVQWNKRDDPGGEQKRWSAGIRPQYNFSDLYSIAAEVGYDQSQVGDGPTNKLTKLTLAPQVSLTRGFWARPVLRAFVTYADWNSTPSNSNVANGVFGTTTAGTSFGVQVEAWW
jgi:maltoporin